MRDTLLKIGEMAELNHVSTQTLRLYDRNKLLEPQYMDPETGYRYYTLEQCAKLDLIRALKSCRLPLQKIQEIFELSSEERLLQVLEEQTGALSEEIYSLSVSRNNLLRIQKSLQVLSALPPSYFINVGTIMDKEHFVNGTYTSHSAFIFGDELYPATGNIRILPQNMYLSVASDNTSLEAEYAKKLYEELQRQNMTPCGDYICEVLTQFPLYHSGQLIYKIQIPVRRRQP